MYNELRGRGVLVHSFTPQKAHFHPHCEYNTVLQEAKNFIFQGGQGEAIHVMHVLKSICICIFVSYRNS